MQDQVFFKAMPQQFFFLLYLNMVSSQNWIGLVETAINQLKNMLKKQRNAENREKGQKRNFSHSNSGVGKK